MKSITMVLFLIYIGVSILLMYQMVEDNISRLLALAWILLSCVLSIWVVVMGYRAKTGEL
jgi:membrane protein YdbS with pleckstrin-like domain